MTLHRFWFEFAIDCEIPPGFARGCGVTAHDVNDARQLLRERVFGGRRPPIIAVVEDVDVSTLDAGHVIPNMLPPTIRGIWFPLGYQG